MQMKRWLVAVVDGDQLRRFRHPIHGHTMVISDIVYFDPDMTAEEVKKSLIDHDNYPPEISVTEG